MMKINTIFGLHLVLAVVAGDYNDVVISDGVVRGLKAGDGDYYSFLGIPYAAAPIGEYRYKAPQPPKPWNDVFTANRTVKCPQKSGGVEDCLAINVFAARGAVGLPVMVYIHGGGYLMNTAPTKGLGHLVEKGIIVVSFNYRLGTLGFLCLGTKEAPGNAGLKDQVAALRWVKNNIVRFGGSPENITVVGTSAGAASIHILAMSDAAKGLFHRAICLDGTATAQFSVTPNPITHAKTYAKMLGYKSDDIKELAKFYQEVSVDKIIKQSLNYFTLIEGELRFCPCVEIELDGVENIMTKPPVLNMNKINISMIFSFSDYEASLEADIFYSTIDKFNDNFAQFIPIYLDIPKEKKKYVAEDFKAYYFGYERITNSSIVEYSNYWGDNKFVFPAVYNAKANSVKYETFLLKFTYEGGLSNKKILNVPGASHGDISNYLIPQKNATDYDRKIVEELAMIVSSFVKTGVPALSLPWPPIQEKYLTYLHIGNSTSLEVNPYTERIGIWQGLYQKYKRTDYVSDYEERNSSTRLTYFDIANVLSILISSRIWNLIW